MQIKITGDRGVYTVAVDGRIDSGTVGELHAVLDGVVSEGGTNLVLDFSGVDFMSSASLRMLLDVLNDVRSRGGDLRLAGVQSPVAKIFDLTGFAGILQMFPDVEAAAASYGAA
jgi:anti-anti-sigma factor